MASQIHSLIKSLDQNIATVLLGKPGPIRLAIVALLLSWVPDVALLFINEPGVTVPAVVSLMVMHAAAAAIAVMSLVRIAGARS